jgi:hypothetical protein
MLQTRVVKEDGAPEKHLVYGEVFAPNRPDAQGEFMTADEILKMAHNFVRSRKFDQIDVMHDNKVVKCEIVESWVAPEGDTTFIPGSWCIGMHIPDEGLWQDFKSGKLNGFSMEALVVKVDREVEVEVPSEIVGRTTKAEGHEHTFFVKYSDDLKFLGGVTDTVNGHSHSIAAGTHTQEAQGHTHRFSSVDNIQILG